MINIPIFTRSRNSRLPRQQANTALRNQLAGYIHDRGIWMDLDAFAESIRHFFDESQIHHSRLAWRDAIGECLGLDMTSPRDRDALWRQIATERGCNRKTRIQWSSEEIDPPVEELRIYFRSLRSNGRQPQLDDVIGPVRAGIARTLVYIRVFPPAKAGADVTDAKPESVKHCREQMRKHVHYRKRRNLNQHAVDSVRDEYRNTLWLEADTIGELKRQVENYPSDPMFATWMLFKFATFTDVHSSNKPKANPYKWIWDDSHPRYADIWSVHNG